MSLQTWMLRFFAILYAEKILGGIRHSAQKQHVNDAELTELSPVKTRRLRT